MVFFFFYFKTLFIFIIDYIIYLHVMESGTKKRSK